MYLEYNWCFATWQLRFGETWTDWRGYRSLSLEDWRYILGSDGYMIKKIDSRTFEIVKK